MDPSKSTTKMSGSVPNIAVTNSDGETRNVSCELFLSDAKSIIRIADQDMADGKVALEAALHDTFISRAMHSLLNEAEKYTRGRDNKSGLLPPGWVPVFLSLIEKAENQLMCQDGGGIPTATSRASVSTPSTERETTKTEVNPTRRCVLSEDEGQIDVSAVKNDNDNDDSSNDNTSGGMVDEFLDDLQSLPSAINTQMAHFEARLKKRKMNKADRLSALEREAQMLTTLSCQIIDLSERPDAGRMDDRQDLWERMLQRNLTAVQAILNIQCRELELEREESVEEAGGDGDGDDSMVVELVMENKRRTEIVLQAQRKLIAKRNLRQGMVLLGMM